MGRQPVTSRTEAESVIETSCRYEHTRYPSVYIKGFVCVIFIIVTQVQVTIAMSCLALTLHERKMRSRSRTSGQYSVILCPVYSMRANNILLGM
jgi:hypothetical protein